MRWTRNDTLAYDAVSKVGKQFLDALDERRAGEAYDKAVSGMSSPEMTKARDLAADTASGVAIATGGGLTPTSAFGGAVGERPTYGGAPVGGFDSSDFANSRSMAQAGIDPRGQASRAEVANKLVASSEPTAQQKRLVGLQALESHYASKGDKENALKYGTMYDQAESSALQREAAKLGISGAKLDLSAKERAAKLDDIIRAAGSSDTKEFLAAAAKFGTEGVPDGRGFSFEIDPQSGAIQLQEHNRETREVTGKAPWVDTPQNREALIGKLVKYSNAGAFNDARKEAKADVKDERVQTREDKKVADADAASERTYELTKMHYGVQEDQARKSHSLAQKRFEEEQRIHSAGYPTYDAAKLTLDRETNWNEGLDRLAQMQEKGASPEEVLKFANQLETKHRDKMVSGKRKTADGMEETFLMSPLEERSKRYVSEYVNKKQAEANELYPSAGIQVVADKSGRPMFADKKSKRDKDGRIDFKSSIDELDSVKALKKAGSSLEATAKPIFSPGSTPTNQANNAYGRRDAEFAKSYYGYTPEQAYQVAPGMGIGDKLSTILPAMPVAHGWNAPFVDENGNRIRN